MKIAICFTNLFDSFTNFQGFTLAKALHNNNVDVYLIIRGYNKRKNPILHSKHFGDLSFFKYTTKDDTSLNAYVLLHPYITDFSKNIYHKLFFYHFVYSVHTNIEDLYISYKRFHITTFSTTTEMMDRVFYKWKRMCYLHYAPLGLLKQHLNIKKIKQKDKTKTIYYDTAFKDHIATKLDTQLSILTQCGFKIIIRGYIRNYKLMGYVKWKSKKYDKSDELVVNMALLDKAMFFLINGPIKYPINTILYAMSRGCVVLVDSPIQPPNCYYGINCVHVRKDTIVQTVYKLMQDKEEYERIRNGGYLYVQQYCNADNNVTHFLETLCRYTH